MMETSKTSLTCPECGGALERIRDGNLLQYRCRVGHMYSADSALIAHTAREENTLWTAVVLLQEGAEIAIEIANNRNDETSADLRKDAQARRELAERVREVVLELPAMAAVSGETVQNG